MSAAIETQIADAVVAELNDPQRVWAGQINAVRSWLPVYQITDLAALKVSVVPLTIAEQERIARRTIDKMQYQIGIDFQQQIDVTAGTGPLDALTFLAQQVHDFYRDGHTLATLPNALVLKATREDVYSLEQLYAEHLWETLVLLNVLLFRDAINFDPRTSIPSLLAWWHADYGTYQDTAGTVAAASDGAPIARVNDHSANGRNLLQATAGQRPQLKLAIQNGLPVIRFDGVSSFLQALFSGFAQPCTYFLAGNLRSLGAPSGNDGVTSGGSTKTYGLIVDNRPETQIAGASQTALPGYSALYPSWSVVTVQSVNGAWLVRENRTQKILASSGGAGDVGGFTLGANFDGTNPTALDLGEVLVYGAGLTIEQIQQIEFYLRTRWGTP